MVDRSILKCDCIRCVSESLISADTPNEQTFSDTPTGDSVLSWRGSYLETHFEANQDVDADENFTNATNIRLNTLVPIASFSSFKLSTTSAKQLETIGYTRLICLLCRVITSLRKHKNCSIDFARKNDREKECLDNKKIWS